MHYIAAMPPRRRGRTGGYHLCPVLQALFIRSNAGIRLMSQDQDLPGSNVPAPRAAQWGVGDYRSDAEYPPEPEADLAETLRQWLGTTLRYRWLVLLIIVVGTILGFVASRYTDVQYRAQATIWVEAATEQTDRGPIRQDGLLAESRAWTELLRSFVVLDPVVQELKLFVQPARPEDSERFAAFQLGERPRFGRYRLHVGADGMSYTLRTPGDSTVERGRLDRPVGTAAGFTWEPPPLAPETSIDFELRPPRDVSVQLARELQIRSNDLRGSFLRVELTGPTSQGVAATLHAVVERFVDVAGDLKRAKLDELTEILAEQLAVAENNLRNAEMALEGFRVQTITLPSEQTSPVAAGIEATRDPVFSRFFSLRITADQLRLEREAIDRLLAAPTLSVEGLEAVGSVRSSSALNAALQELNEKRAELRALRARYTDEHQLVAIAGEEVRALETTTIPALARQLQQELDLQAGEITRQIESAGTDLRQIPPRMIEEARLRRQVAIDENLYRTLQQRYAEARLAAASSIPDVRLLDAPSAPHRPIPGKSRVRIILMALAGSFGAAAGLVVLLARLDSKVRYPTQITAGLGLPILATVPRLNAKRGTGDGEQQERLTEAFRTLRFNLVQAYGTAGPVVLAISSPGRGEGKSFVARQLAIAMAGVGYRTLLVDGDVRRGVLHRAFAMKRGEGLLDCLRNGVEIENYTRRTSFDHLDLLTGGRRLARGPELLGSAAMAQLLARARASYDVVIVDAPPFGAAADPFVLGTLTGNMIIVLRTGASERHAMALHMDGLYRLPIRLLGAVMNDVPDSGVYRYYSYAYLAGYEARDEADLPDDDEPLRLAGSAKQ
jgi:capsular exopolysaccharide synthesis family protein